MIESEVESFLAEYLHERDASGRQRLVRNGYLPEREIQTGIGGVPVKADGATDLLDQAALGVGSKGQFAQPGAPARLSPPRHREEGSSGRFETPTKGAAA